MGDMAEGWKEHNEQRRERGERRKLSSTKILEEKGLIFSCYNSGRYLVIHGEESLIDFWPGTGKFIVRKDKDSGWGLDKLLKLC